MGSSQPPTRDTVPLSILQNNPIATNIAKPKTIILFDSLRNYCVLRSKLCNVSSFFSSCNKIEKTEIYYVLAIGTGSEPEPHHYPIPEPETS
jgi:hypothetical protein